MHWKRRARLRRTCLALMKRLHGEGLGVGKIAKQLGRSKDTVHKHSLLYHLTFSVLESLPTASDLYSEVANFCKDLVLVDQQ